MALFRFGPFRTRRETRGVAETTIRHRPSPKNDYAATDVLVLAREQGRVEIPKLALRDKGNWLRFPER